MWEALCKGISRFELINNFEHIFISYANKNNLRIYLGSNLKNSENIEGQQRLWYSYRINPSVKIVFLTKIFIAVHLVHQFPQVFFYNAGHLEFTFCALVTRHIQFVVPGI